MKCKQGIRILTRTMEILITYKRFIDKTWGKSDIFNIINDRRNNNFRSSFFTGGRLGHSFYEKVHANKLAEDWKHQRNSFPLLAKGAWQISITSVDNAKNRYSIYITDRAPWFQQHGG